VLDGAMAWAKAELKRNPPKSTDSKADVKTALGDILNLIRFPCMELNDIALKVSSIGLLDQPQTLALFTYLGQKAAKSDKKSSIALDACIKMFSTKPREGENISRQCFDQNKQGGAIVFEKGKADETCRTGGSGYWTCARGMYRLKQLSKKRVYWEAYVVSAPGTGCIGVAKDAASMRPSSYGCDYNSWIYYGNGYKATSANAQAYGGAYNAGATIGVLADVEKNTVSFYLNGASQGQAFSVPDIGDCYPWFGMHNAGDSYRVNWRAKPPS